MSRSCDYFYKSIVFLLFDILLWFKAFVDDHQDIEQDAIGNYHFKDAIFAYTQIHEKYTVGAKVKIFEVVKNTKSTKNDYPNFISKFKVNG